MRAFTAAWLLLRGALHVVRGYLIIRFQFPKCTPAQRGARVQAWARELLGIWRIDLEVRGQPPFSGPMLLVSNHISWLDIVVMHAACYCRFVAKADVKSWPVIGLLATGAGTLYITRESRRDALRTVHHMSDALQQGEVLAVFPEGTTSNGLALLPFHANLLQAAISADAPVQPVALQFIDSASGEISLAPCYVGDETLVGSVWRTLTTPGVRAVVSYGQPQKAEGRERREWAECLRQAVDGLRH